MARNEAVIPNETQQPCRTLVARLTWKQAEGGVKGHGNLARGGGGFQSEGSCESTPQCICMYIYTCFFLVFRRWACVAAPNRSCTHTAHLDSKSGVMYSLHLATFSFTRATCVP